ncbi:BACON domain-containing protein [Streptacidiphilus rugosus]|uniref:BACON domain-containing protein n=1 Tax=Streptacidiphilus rugosus TaxID=405783 RepID=UPI00068F8E05|nr:hypothetical protein [Streptacidiphilus rugosus]
MDTVLDQLADALFSYSLSVLCDQDEAVVAVRQTRRLAARHRRRLRRPEQQRAWLYALARYVCLVRLEARGQGDAPRLVPQESGAARSRLARLAWPEAAGTTPAQREALELAGRHGLEPVEIAAVLGLRADAASVLLSQAVCEVERTAAALAVLVADACPELRRLGRGRGPVLGRALRGELVRHLDDCPTCRGTAERGAAEGPWPGTFRAPGSLPLVHLPRAALRAAAGRAEPPLPEPRFDRRGFPQHLAPEEEHAALVRHRALIGSVAAAVVAVPAAAIWTVHSAEGPSVPAAQVTSVRVANPPSTPPAATPTGADASSTGLPAGAGSGHLGENVSFTGVPSAAPTPIPVTSDGGPQPPVGVPVAGPGVLTVTATQSGARTLITLANSGGSPLLWTATSRAPWLRLSRDGGTLAPGAQLTVLVTVDEAAAPTDAWTAQILFRPSGSVVTLSGSGSRRGIPTPTPTPTPTRTSTPTPTASPSPSGGATASPTPSPTVTPSDTASGSAAPTVTAR